VRILLVEDNRDLAANLIDFLELHDCQIDYAVDGSKALVLSRSGQHDLIVLDVMMPGMDGYQVCQQLRKDGHHQPVLFLTARDTLDDKLEGFSAGGDDYLVKPFALPELWVRLQALYKRSFNQRGTLLQLADLTMNLDRMTLQRAGTPISLNPACWKLLRLLLQSSPDVVPREQLEYELWGEETPDSDALRTHLYNLRRKIDKPFETPLIHTVHGVGVCLRTDS